MKTFDLIVIGGGSAGFAAALRGHELGARVGLIHAGTLGGTCVNVGCVPSKTLIRAAEAHHRAGRHGFAGITSTSRVDDFQAVVQQKDELVASLRTAKYVEVLRGLDRVELVEGRARFVGPTQLDVEGSIVAAPKVVVATGARPWIPPIPGLAEAGGHVSFVQKVPLRGAGQPAQPAAAQIGGPVRHLEGPQSTATGPPPRFIF